MNWTNCEIANRRNMIDNNDRSIRWNHVKSTMYKSNSLKSHQKVRVVKRVPVRRSIKQYDILSSILPTKEELLFDILGPTIKRSIRSKLCQ